jgi:uncharacterized protein (DUF4415 family)
MSKGHTIKYELNFNAPPPLTEKQKLELKALGELPEEEIDYSDIPESLEFYRPIKKSTTLRIDADVLAWLRSGGKGYQTRINSILRREMVASQAKEFSWPMDKPVSRRKSRQPRRVLA